LGVRLLEPGVPVAFRNNENLERNFGNYYKNNEREVGRARRNRRIFYLFK
jgi:hypothetical protein